MKRSSHICLLLVLAIIIGGMAGCGGTSEATSAQTPVPSIVEVPVESPPQENASVSDTEEQPVTSINEPEPVTSAEEETTPPRAGSVAAA